MKVMSICLRIRYLPGNGVLSAGVFHSPVTKHNLLYHTFSMIRLAVPYSAAPITNNLHKFIADTGALITTHTHTRTGEPKLTGEATTAKRCCCPCCLTAVFARIVKGVVFCIPHHHWESVERGDTVCKVQLSRLVRLSTKLGY